MAGERSTAGPIWAIVNPAAGAGRCGRQWPAMAAQLAQAGCAAVVRQTSGHGDASVMAAEAGRAGAGIIIAAGGDGTVHEVVNGLMAVPSERRPTVAVCHLGTGGDFARLIGAKPASLVASLATGRTRPIDVGRLVYREDGQERHRYFINCADFGIGRATAKAAEGGPKRLGPVIAYLYAALLTISRYTPTPIRLVVDEQEAYAGPAALVAMANGQDFAGGMRVAPHAKPDDGLLEIGVVAGVSKARLAFDLLPRVYFGAHMGRPGVQFFQGRSATIEAAGPLPLEADGEGLGSAPATVSVLPGALRVVVPPASAGR